MILDQHIAVFESAMSHETCKNYINYFETVKALNKTFTRESMSDGLKHTKDDETFFPIDKFEDLNLSLENIHFASEVLFNLGEKYQEYVSAYSVLKDSCATHSVYSMRVQKTQIGGGYHRWHFENGNIKTSNRLVVWMFYLNDVEEGGETEFLYLHKRIKAKAGTLVIWPATYTHTHRGNPPLSNDKYIITGWMEY